MNSAYDPTIRPGPGAEARARLLAAPGDPILEADWRRVLFFHHRIDAEQIPLPDGFELERYEGSAWITVVALTMQRFRPRPASPWWAWALGSIREQRFLNVRTYVRYRDEPGLFFLWGWLSRPLFMPLPEQPGGLTCGFARLKYDHQHERGELTGSVHAGDRRFVYRAALDRERSFDACAPGSLAEFTLERYSGFYWHRGAGRVFRAWHDPWQIATVEATIEHQTLLTTRWPWFRDAKLEAVHYTPGFSGVWLGRSHRLAAPAERLRHCGASTFFTMP